jgi:hypothetical protein
LWWSAPRCCRSSRPPRPACRPHKRARERCRCVFGWRRASQRGATPWRGGAGEGKQRVWWEQNKTRARAAAARAE